MSTASEILRRIAQKLLDDQKEDALRHGAISTTPTPPVTISAATVVPLTSTTHVSSEIGGTITEFAGITGEGDSAIKRIIKDVLKMSQEELCARPSNRLNDDCKDINTVAGIADSPVASSWVFENFWVYVSCMLAVGGLVVIVVSIIIYLKQPAVSAGKSAAKQQYVTRVQQFCEDRPGSFEPNASVDSSVIAVRGSEIQFGLNSAERHDLLVTGYLDLHRRELQARGFEVPVHLYESIEGASSHGSDVLSRLLQQKDQTGAGGNNVPSLLYRTVDCTGEVSASYGDLIQVNKTLLNLNELARLLCLAFGYYVMQKKKRQKFEPVKNLYL